MCCSSGEKACAKYCIFIQWFSAGRRPLHTVSGISSGLQASHAHQGRRQSGRSIVCIPCRSDSMSSSALVSHLDSIVFPLPVPASAPMRRPRPAVAIVPSSTPFVESPDSRLVAPHVASELGASASSIPGSRVVGVARGPSVPVAKLGQVVVPLETIGGVALSSSLSGGLTLRRQCVDVLLVGVWAALVPGFMWLGHYAGF